MNCFPLRHIQTASFLVGGQSSRLRHTQIVQIVIGLTKNPEIYLHFQMKKTAILGVHPPFSKTQKGCHRIVGCIPVNHPLNHLESGGSILICVDQ